MDAKRAGMSLVLMIALVSWVSGPGWSQVGKERDFSFAGVIEQVDDHLRFIVVNEAKIFISGETAIVNDRGTVLKASDLKRRFSISLEGVRRPEGFFAKRIVVHVIQKP
jgi:hypothetical protein